ncbi:hypothetical protein K443DRAFT_130030 [Laccaria amethystina LaAM-08-1]|uniref:Uncharacterized protein n=1 Tax=Laccaria amethystina LaAM-08-1 TaxID=1095629 RepID=A0A0C9XX27_9AGAR|nr:hypothetical protein K443DRAFT_130030 [Laccaria amethystina LaAM-08-1]
MTLTIVNLLSVLCHRSSKYRVNRFLCYPCNIMYGSSVPPPMPHLIFVHHHYLHLSFYIFSVCSRWDLWTSNYPFAPLSQVFSLSMYIFLCVPVFRIKLALIGTGK